MVIKRKKKPGQSQAALLPSRVVRWRCWACCAFVSFESLSRVRYTFVPFEASVFGSGPHAVRHGASSPCHSVLALGLSCRSNMPAWGLHVIRDIGVGLSCVGLLHLPAVRDVGVGLS